MTKFYYLRIVLPLIIVVIVGCGKIQPNVTYIDTNANGEIEYDLTEALQNKSVSFLDDMIDSIKIIPLDSDQQSLFSMIWNIEVSSKNIYIQDNSRIIIFNQLGKFIKSLDKGPGPKEIGHPRAMSFDEKTKCLYVYDGIGSKIMKFTEEGHFLSYYPMPSLPIRDIAVSDTLLFFAHHGMNNNFAISVGDTVFNNINTYVFGSDHYFFLFRKYLMPYDGGFNVKKLLDNKIYYLKDTLVRAKYLLKYPMMNVQYSQYNSINELDSDIPADEFLFSGDYLESKDYLFTIFKTNGFDSGFSFKTLLTHKATGKSVCFEGKPHSLISFISIESIVCGNNNWFVGIIYPESFAATKIDNEYYWDGSNPCNLLSEDEMRKLRAVDEEDNPIVVLFKLKEFPSFLE